jgi:RNA polymerase sigma-70 factor, ECF subfamily
MCVLQPGRAIAGIKGQMEGEVRHLLQARRYDEALERLLDLYQRKVFRLAVSMLKDGARAEEVTQDIFLKVWRALPVYDGRASLSTWVYTIARNTCLSAVRNDTYRRTAPLTSAAEPVASAVTGRDLDLEQALLRLPDVLRQVITLFYLQDRSVKDVAEMLGMPEGTVKSHLHRARHTLAALMR